MLAGPHPHSLALRRVGRLALRARAAGAPPDILRVMIYLSAASCLLTPIRSVALLLACAVLARPPAAGLTRFEFQQPHMGTTVRVVLYASDAPAAEALAAAAFSRMAALEDRLSDYRESSELMALCRAAGDAPVPVSHDLFTVLTAAHAFASRTDGAFDVTVGPVSRVWRHARATGELPDSSRLAEAQRLVGFAKMQLSPERRTVRLAERGMLLDLGGNREGVRGRRGSGGARRPRRTTGDRRHRR